MVWIQLPNVSIVHLWCKLIFWMSTLYTLHYFSCFSPVFIACSSFFLISLLSSPILRIFSSNLLKSCHVPINLPFRNNIIMKICSCLAYILKQNWHYLSHADPRPYILLALHLLGYFYKLGGHIINRIGYMFGDHIRSRT